MKSPRSSGTPSHRKELVRYNPEHPLATDVAEAVSAQQERHIKLLALQNQEYLTPDIKKKLQDKKKGIYRELAATMGLNFDKFSTGVRDVIDDRSARFSSAIKDRISEKSKFGGVDKQPALPPAPTQPIDHSFWWALTQPILGEGFSEDFPDDGLHFFGSAFEAGHDEEKRSFFGASALFTLERARLPNSPSGWFTSSPHVDLIGAITAFAPDWDLLQGDGIAECKLFTRQTIYQFGFASTFLPVREAINEETIIYLKNTGAPRTSVLPGFKLLPSVQFNQTQFDGNRDLYAQIEVRLDIYLNSRGAQVFCDPQVLLRTFQWSLDPA
jgi:hypothetical protein